ncbi:hypothetical protein K458DRAFT_412864 [Lentithecium fluviatile CBS 122367]|uniref:IEC3 subunit of the Ino80 complex, chromatin re-modelling-domain-containing protein n=1 Tax=Lentithecium fluviatile CBS 122367 TaxID=1168545 RepID=A0A6G1JIF4_9PLEO|nr:hypothetical protein K458DRAFT_412864 [Lentithecium fluviatile CBS 122367]
MRIKFEDTMTASSQLILDEWKAQALARRLQEQNDQILEILLDINDAARLPATLRFDLRSLPEIEAADAALETDPSPELMQQKLHHLRAELANELITAEEYAKRAEQLHNLHPVKPGRSLAGLEAKVPHTLEAPDPPIDGIDLTDTAPSYLDPTHEEEYLVALDLFLADPAYNSESHDDRPHRHNLPPQGLPSEKDLTIRNPDSVYNWLRKNQPQVFLQDKDAPHPENASEKSSARTANASGRLKRQSNVGTPGPKTDHDDEDAFVPESGTGGKGRKSKGGGGEDDSAYRPKGGSSRPAKRKREDGDVAPKGGRKKNRVSAGVAS